MSRLFDDAANDYMQATDAGIDVPITMACWFNTDDLTTVQMLMAINNTTTDPNKLNGHILRFIGSVDNDPFSVVTQEPGAFGEARSAISPAANTWHHAAGVWASTSSRSIYVNGANKVTNGDLTGNPGHNVINIGAGYYNSALIHYVSGMVAEAAIWNAALTDAEIAILALGYSPLGVRPQSLFRYYPLIGKTSPEIELIGGSGMTLTGTVAAPHPRVFYPGISILPSLAAAAEGPGPHSFGYIF